MTDNHRPFGGQDVAVFIDFENIYISVVAEYDVNPDFEALMEKASEFGRVSVAQAYADWTPYSHYINSLHAYQIDPMYVPAYHYGEGGNRKGAAIKNSVDMFLCINAMKMLYSHLNIQTFVLVTGDRDFVPLIKTIREFGKRAVVIGVAGASSSHLAQAADDFFFYHQITDNLKPSEKDKGKTRDPYDVLVEAVKLARQRGYVATLGSLKLLMTELMSNFESLAKDSKGRPIQRFKDFVKEAERRGKVRLHATGAVNEVFLPNEDPRKVSQFAGEAAPTEPAGEEIEPSENEPLSETPVEISRDHWKLFINTMAQFDSPVPFVRVFDALRGLRNQNLLDLSNKEVKDMIIQAIHLGLLTRFNRRGRRTLYQLTQDTKTLGQYVENVAAVLPMASSSMASSDALPIDEMVHTTSSADAMRAPDSLEVTRDGVVLGIALPHDAFMYRDEAAAVAVENDDGPNDPWDAPSAEPSPTDVDQPAAASSDAPVGSMPLERIAETGMAVETSTAEIDATAPTEAEAEEETATASAEKTPRKRAPRRRVAPRRPRSRPRL